LPEVLIPEETALLIQASGIEDANL
jgi:hypothetical protein